MLRKFNGGTRTTARIQRFPVKRVGPRGPAVAVPEGAPPEVVVGGEVGGGVTVTGGLVVVP
jgi:hypothetical protein